MDLGFAVDPVLKSLQSNQFLSGGAVLMVLGGAFAYMRNTPARIFQYIKKRVIFSVQIDSKDQSLPWLKLWLSEHEYSEKKTRSFILRTKDIETDLFNEVVAPRLQKGGSIDQDPKDAPELIMFPSPGNHFLKYKGRWIWLDFNREKMTQNDRFMGYEENFNITVLGGGGKKLVKDLIFEAYALSNPKEDPKVRIHTVRYDGWYFQEEKEARPLDSLIYSNSLERFLYDDIMKFYSDKDWYKSMGIPWKRGYLLEGPPGNGKSSLVLAMAGALKTNIYVLNLASTGMDDEKISTLLGSAPKGSIILIEEVDTVTSGRKVEKGSGFNDLTFSGLLNALDGVASKEGRILFMTTNHKDKLDPALIRPGRADIHLRIDNADFGQMVQMFLRFYPGESQQDAEEFAASVPEGTVSMACLQEYLMSHRGNPKGALSEVHTLLNATEFREISIHELGKRVMDELVS